MEDPGGNRLDAATTRSAGEGTRWRSDQAMDVTKVARGKKNARRQKAWIFFQDESGISQRPSVRRTWARRGKTPLLIHSFNWSKTSVSAVIGYRWDGKRCRLFFHTLEGNYDTDALIVFLQDLKKHMGGKKAILIWDNLPSHKSRAMTDYLSSQRSWLRVERLPGYAPDLNPVETLWGNIKGQELANRCAQDLDESVDALCRGMERVRRSRVLSFSFLCHSGLSF